MESPSIEEKAGSKEQYLTISTQIFISYFFNVLIIACQPLLTFLLTRILSIEEYGVYSILFTTISILSVIFRFGLVDYIRTKIPGLNEEARRKHFATIVSFLLLSLFSLSILLYLFKEPLLRFLSLQKYTYLWLPTILLIISITFYDLINSYLISIKKIFLGSISSFVVRCLWILILFLLFIILGRFSLNQVFILWMLGMFFPLFSTLLLLKSELFYFLEHPFEIKSELLKPALGFSLPLVLFVSLSFIVDSSNRYIINYFLGKTDLAIYSLASGLAATIASIPIIFQSVIHPYFAEKWNLNQDSSFLYNILLKYSLLIALPIIAGVFSFRQEIIIFISGSNYLKAAPILALLLIYSLILIFIEIFSKTLLLRNMLKHLLLIYFSGAVLNLILNLIFVPLFGLQAAAYSTIITYFLILIILFYHRPKEIVINFKFLKLTPIFISSFLLGLLLINLNPQNYILKLILIILGVFSHIIFLLIFNVFNEKEKDLLKSVGQYVVQYVVQYVSQNIRQKLTFSKK